MSAFMLSNVSICTIAANMAALSSRDGTAEDPVALAKKLHAMNRRAIVARYGEGIARQDCQPFAWELERPALTRPGLLHPWTPEAWAPIVKLARCLIYQCSEGNVPKMALYRRVERFSENVALSIVRSLPAYDAADWG